MKKLNVSAISDSARFPLKKGTLQFLQDAPKEVLADLIKALIGPTYNPATMYVMSGCINSTTAPTYNVSAGVLFYNGEVYDFDGASFTATGGNVAVWSIIQSQYTTDADPVTFTDLTPRNVHNIFKMQLAQAASGSGLSDISASAYLSFQIPAQVNLSAPGSAPYAGNQMQLIGSYPNYVLYVPAASNLNPALASGSVNVGNGVAGGSDFNVVFGTALLTSNYIVMGSLVSLGTPDVDSTFIWTIRNRTTTGFTVHMHEDTAGTVQNVAWDWIAFSK
jgi:hypothetical protein